MALIPITSKFNFYQQIRLLLRKLRNNESNDASILDENFRITSSLSLESPDGQIENIYQKSSSDPIEVIALINGLTGVMGALPTTYSEWMIERQYRYSDYSAKSFIDIFDHRLFCLDYLSWQKSHSFAQSETQTNSPFEKILLAMIGVLNSPPPLILTQHAFLFSSPVRSMVCCEQWLSQMFDVTVTIKPFTGNWCTVEKNECCQIGNKLHSLKTAPMLGIERIEVNSSFDVILGPMQSAESLPFLLNGRKLQMLCSSIRTYIGPVIDFSVSMIIDISDLQPKPLGEGAVGIDYCLGHYSGSKLFQKRITKPNF
ncbi:type VI secretion system baseplate subunit TssG [Citrobacter cronae]|uniref:type VI secretion system baseplate subunit TssG n=1 Tax=Citrobacter cronae TaxID=1748967 RepID=UPI001C1212F2|nr:type VI secretion system baseplate subunit TssG [Citrobacter cronae]MBU5388692.1 type VI secretion system baseplate subunit TssG [Citrobacter cronae]